MRVSLTLRELFLVILLVATVSLFLNIQANNYGVLLNAGNLVFTSNVSYDVTDSGFVIKQAYKIVGGRSLNQHGPEMMSLHEKALNRSSSELMQRLIKIENRLMSISKQPIIALVNENVTNDVKEEIHIKNIPFKITNTLGLKNLGWIDENTVIQGGNWSILLCEDPTACPEYRGIVYKKVNSIKAMKEYINNSSKLCELSRHIDGEVQGLNCDKSEVNGYRRTIGMMGKSDKSPKHSRDNELGGLSGVRDKTRGSNSPQVLPGLMLSASGPLLRLRMLVTSMVPLRFYIHPSVLSGHDASDSDKSFDVMTVEDSLQYISNTYGLGMSSRWWVTFQTTLVKYLTQINIQTLHDRSDSRCDRCFMEIHADLTCSSIEHCLLVQLKSARTKVTQEMLDTLFITSPYTSPLQDITIGLLETQVCENSNSEDCLTNADLIFLLDSRREQLIDRNWIKIYPSKNGNAMYGDIDDVDRVLRRRHSGLTNRMLSYMEQYYARIDSHNKNTLDIPYDTDVEVHSNEQNHEAFSHENNECSEDPEFYKAIDTIHTVPKLELKQIKHSYMYSEVPYDTIIIRIWASAKHCHCIVKLDNKYNSNGARNVSIGLGNNTFHLLVIDRTVADPRIVSSVTLTIYRHTRVKVITTGFTNTFQCELKQDCTLPFNKNDTCGLHKMIDQTIRTQRCTSGDQEGRWLVRCTDCTNPHSCIWGEAKWQPFRCSYRRHTTQSLKRCLNGKKLLFIGDSTNRGIMNYIMERINGTLHQWDKIHNTRTFTNLNDNSTHFTFAYYPLFWLPMDHRPRFQKIIYQLIKSSLPLHNNSSTVLIVGGVQWLAREHIDSIIEALKRKGLLNITIVIKGLGAGFHQPIEGIRFVPQERQAALQRKESDILAYAKDKGCRVVSTFNMTLARYQDFLEGKCACHFHKVTKLPHDEISDSEVGYSISGDVNAAYSDIIADQLCGG